MLVTIFDTETTGLPSSYILEKENVSTWPYILQFSFVVYDMELHQVVTLVDEIICLPSNITISKESENIHGISKEMVEKKGVALEPLLNIFLEYCEKSELVIGHNVEFDYKMVCAELMRLSESEKFRKFKFAKNFFCTMKSTINLCNIKAISKSGKEYVKYPSLKELHFTLFKREPKNLHNAINDVLICFRCFYKLKYDEDVLDKDTTMCCLLYHVLHL